MDFPGRMRFSGFYRPGRGWDTVIPSTPTVETVGYIISPTWGFRF